MKAIKQSCPGAVKKEGSILIALMVLMALMLFGERTTGQETENTEQPQAEQQEEADAQEQAAEREERPAQPVPAERAAALREAGVTPEQSPRRVPESRPPGSRAVQPAAGGEPADQDAAASAEQAGAAGETAEATTAEDVQPEMGQGVEQQSAQPRLTPQERAQALRRSGAVNRRLPSRRAGVNPARLQEEMMGAADEDTQARIEMMREHLQQYYENQRLISKERTDWQLTEQMLTARINHMQQQIEEVRSDTTKLREDVTESDVEKNEMAEKNQKLGELQDYQRRQVEKLERKARTLVDYLPEPLKQKLSPLIDRLPAADADPEEIEVSVAQRYPTVLGIFTQIDKFNRGIQLEMDTYELEAGDEVQVQVLYLGLGQGYMVQAGQEEGGIAAVGRPSPEGWVWDRRDELAPEIRKVIRIYEGEATAEFVGLPATVK